METTTWIPPKYPEVCIFASCVKSLASYSHVQHLLGKYARERDNLPNLKMFSLGKPPIFMQVEVDHIYVPKNIIRANFNQKSTTIQA